MLSFQLKFLVFCAVLSLTGLGTVISGADSPRLPETKTVPVADTLHGVEIPDNYRWLEDGENPEVLRWDSAQDAYCRSILENYEKRDYIKERIEELMQIGSIGGVMMFDDRLFYTRRDEGQDQPVYYMQNGIEGERKVLIDPNSLTEDGTVAIDYFYPSNDGKYAAYGKSSLGTELSTLFILDCETGKNLKDTIASAYLSTVAWLNDNSGFYYSRNPEPGTVPEGEERFYRKIYFHEIGSDYMQDELIFGEGRDKTEWSSIFLSPDNEYIFLNTQTGYVQSQLHMKRRNSGDPFRLITDGSESSFYVYPTRDRLYILTNNGAPKYRLMYTSYDRPEMKYWKTLIPEADGTISGMSITRDHVVLSFLENANSRLAVYDLNGVYERDIELPAIGSVSIGYSQSGGEETNQVLFNYNSFFIPTRIYHYDVDHHELRLLDQIATDADLSTFEANQVWFESKDGTPVSMFLIHKKDIQLDGNNPTMVYGYGGFEVSLTPSFSGTRSMFLNDGGIICIVNLRGGGEYGEEWHRAGMLENKQNTYDDMIAASEFLIEKQYTSSKRLILLGGSNGGLTVAAVMVQRPDLFKAVISSRPLLDMLRYHLITVGQYWISEYGSADNPDQFEFIYKYSPYHNVKEGVQYPAVLFASADHDSRVDPSHVRKMTALMQSLDANEQPVLLRYQWRTGHGQGTPVSIRAEEQVDRYCFIYWQLGM